MDIFIGTCKAGCAELIWSNPIHNPISFIHFYIQSKLPGKTLGGTAGFIKMVSLSANYPSIQQHTGS